jgi:uncharacterized protein YifE (UPF0438 family)
MPLIKQASATENPIGTPMDSFHKLDSNQYLYSEAIYSRAVSKKTTFEILEDLKAWVPASILPALDDRWFVLKLRSTINLLLKGERWNFLLVQTPMLIEKDKSIYDLPTDFMHHSALWSNYTSEESGKQVKIEFVYQDQSIVFENGENFYKIKNGQIEFVNMDVEVMHYCCKSKKEGDSKAHTLWFSYYIKPELPKDINREIKWFPDVDEFDEVLRELMAYELYLRAGQRPLAMPDVARYTQLLQIWDKQGLYSFNKRLANTQTFDFTNLIEF